MKLWKISAAIDLPVFARQVSEFTETGLPKSFGKPIYRFEKSLTYDLNKSPLTIRPWMGDGFLRGDHSVETVELCLKINAETALEAIDNAKLDIEFIIDLLSIQLLQPIRIKMLEVLDITAPIRIKMLEVLDITAPIQIGEERDMLIYPYPQGYITLKFQQTMFFGLQPAMNISFPQNSNYSKKVLAAIRWFAKGVSAQFDIDKFNFFWITLEILSIDNAEEVTEGYTPKCGHSIEICSVCKENSFVKRVQGKTLKKYLIDELGVSKQDANKLWNMRQMFHGQNHLTTKSMKDVAKLTLILYSKTLDALKKDIDIPLVNPPNVNIDTPGIVFKNLVSRRKVCENDLNI